MSADRPVFTPYPPPLRVRLLKALTREWQSSPEIARLLDTPSQGVAVRLRAYIADGTVERAGRGIVGDPFCWRLAGEVSSGR